MRPSSATAALRGEEVGQRIASARKERRLSQRELAEAIGVSRDAVSQWERGKTGISWGSLELLAPVLECSEEWLRFGDAAFEQLPAGTHTKSDEAMLTALLDITNRLERIEDALSGRDVSPSADLVASTRRAKQMLTEALDAQDADSTTRAEPDTPRAGDATQGSAPARRAKTPRSATKRAR